LSNPPNKRKTEKNSRKHDLFAAQLLG